MDYDGNDLQNHYFQLVGEDHKFPANVESLSSRKFDLDEHLRFDSLPDTEGLHGIQGQQSNWIEDYSPGDSAIEFSSSAAESCSIIRNNNVWSEATSSESVEMLLKSVGEDEMIVENTVTTDSSADDRLHGMVDHLVLHVKEDESHNLTLRDFRSNDPELTQDSSLKIESDLTAHPSAFPPKNQVLSQEGKVEKSKIVLDSTPSNNGFNFTGRVVSEQHLEGEYYIYQESSNTEIVKDLMMLKDETTKQHMGSAAKNNFFAKQSTFYEPKMDSVSKKCSNSVFSMNSDGLLEVVAYLDKSLNRDMMVCNEVCEKEEHSGEFNFEAIQKVPDLTELCKNNDYRKYDFIKNDEAHMRKYLPIRSSIMSFNEWEKLDTCMDVEEKQKPDDKQAANNNKDVGITPHLTRELYACTPINQDIQATDTIEYHSLDTNGGTESKAVALSLAEDMDVDRQEIMKLDTDEVVNQYRSSVPAATSDVELKTSCSTPCRSCKYDVVTSKEAQDFSSGVCQTTEMTSYAAPTSKRLLQTESSTDTVYVSFQKLSNLHSLNSDDTSDVDAIEQRNETLAHELPASHTTQSDAKNVEMSAVSSLPLKIFLSFEKATDPALVSHLVKAEGTLAEEMPQDLGSTSAFSEKSTSTLLSQEIDGEGPSSCLVVPDSVYSKNDGIELCRENKSNSRKNAVEETLKGVETISVCTEDASLGTKIDSHPLADMEPSLVQSSDYDQCHNDAPSFIVATAGNESPCVKIKDDCANSSGAFSHGNKESALVVSGRKDNSILLEAKIGNRSSFVQNYDSPIIKSCRGSPQNDPEHQELNGSLSDFNATTSCDLNLVSPKKDGITGKGWSRHDLKENGKTSEERYFTFKVTSSEDSDEIVTGSDSKSFSSLQSTENHQMPKEIQPECPEEGNMHFIATKTPDEGKNRDTPVPPTEKEIASEIIVAKSSSRLPNNDATLSKDIPLVHMPEHTYLKSNTDKTSSSLTIHTSSIPDLNSSFPSSTLFYQPFSDLQQVQLRAQIFVYGALISGIPPDEAYMVSSFGGTDGGRSLWEIIWRAIVNKFPSQKSTIGGYATPFSSRPASGVPEQVSTDNTIQREAAITSAVKSSSIVVPSTFPLSSPSLSMSPGDVCHPNFAITAPLDVSQTSSLLHTYKSSQSNQDVGANSPSLSQSPRPGAWLFTSQTSAHHVTAQHPNISGSEAVQPVTAPRIDPCRTLNTTIQASSPSVFLSCTSPLTTTLTPVFLTETTKKALKHRASKNTHTPQIARKSKKGAVTEQPSLRTSQSSSENISVARIGNNIPVLPVSLPLCFNYPLKAATGAQFSVSRPHNTFPIHYQINTGNNTELNAILSEQTYNKIEHTKLQAEEAASLAAASVKHSQAIWTQLGAQRNSGLVSEVEEKIASAAVAAAAAASVAKAAAAAANLASEATLQAKIMVDEAISSAKSGIANQSSENSLCDIGKQLAGLSSVSILKGKDKIHGSGAVISAAREVARRRVEAASAATKWAENLDAIVKAAELVAEAVAQAATIITMGDPLPFPLSSLGDNGPDNFWKAKFPPTTVPSKPNNSHGDAHRGLDSVEDHDTSTKQFNEQFSTIKETVRAADKGIPSVNESHYQLEGMHQGDLSNRENGSFNPVNNSSIQKGSMVEIMSDKEGRMGAWLSARVLDVKDNNAYICYSDLLSHGGQLKEWATLDIEEDKPPRIRIAHSTTTVKYEGTRKRRREHLASYIWTVGDRVDAWIHDGWWEGIVIEKCLGDETKLNVHFPARGDQHIIHVWDLRPSLVWKEGQWMDWSLSREKPLKPHEVDTPKEKRQRLNRNDPVGIGNQPNNVSLEEHQKPNESKSLILLAKDRTFSLGKHGSTTAALQIKRNGLQKEGSKVVFGIPKPGKKRKFMEVSKHYVANNPEKISDGSQSIKFAKYLMPQAGNQSKNTLKVDNKFTQAGESKPKGGVKDVRLWNIQTRSQVEKGSSSTAVSNGAVFHGCHTNFMSRFNSNGSNFAKKKSSEAGSFPPRAELTKLPAFEQENLSKKKCALGSETQFTFKRKPTMTRPTKVEVKGFENPRKAVHEAMERRRSNRQIQPTSRLLEGLQSSLSVSKIISFSQERKSHKCESSSKGIKHG